MALLLDNDHHILHKLAEEILPKVIGAHLFRKQWFVHMALIYGYANDFGAVVAGLGLGPGLSKLLQGDRPRDQSVFDVLRSSLPPGFFVPAAIVACGYLLLQVIVKQQNVVARALLAKEYSRSMDAAYQKLERSLAYRKPLQKGLVEAQILIEECMDGAIKNEVWPFRPPSPNGDYIDNQLKTMISDIRAKFMARWDALPEEEQ